MPAAKPRPGSHPPYVPLELEELIGSEWSGFSFLERRLHMDGYRGRPFTAGDLRAQFYDLQELRILRHEIQRLTREIERLSEALDTAEARAAFYRRQLILESTAGAMLARVMS